MGELVRKYYESGELKEEYFIFNDKKLISFCETAKFQNIAKF